MISCKPPQRLANFVICGIFTYGTDVDNRYLEINDRRHLQLQNFKTTNKRNYNCFQITCLLNMQTYLTITYLTFESITHKNKFLNKSICLFTKHKFILVIFPSLDPLNVANPVHIQGKSWSISKSPWRFLHSIHAYSHQDKLQIYFLWWTVCPNTPENLWFQCLFMH